MMAQMNGKILNVKGFDATIIMSSNLINNLSSAAKVLQNDNFSIILISFAKPASSWLASFERAGLNTEKIFFVDCSVKMSRVRTENVLFIQDPSDLTSIGISISQFLGVIPGKRAVIIDDIGTLKVYNSEETSLKFNQFLIRKIKDYNSKLVVLTSKKRDGFTKKLIPFFDHVINM